MTNRHIAQIVKTIRGDAGNRTVKRQEDCNPETAMNTKQKLKRTSTEMQSSREDADEDSEALRSRKTEECTCAKE
ncbi:hypothetical protein NDU88_002115 [Pleurodeles waltl]|uniref:Uncharacterized protein n=1 Tax=Pleurodeles waltl TaxID=8319 RepID=A0AAV7L0D5_PLEWA|nr:hypothetical protein NDU88_002115 [Pleurodeles waltl]